MLLKIIILLRDLKKIYVCGHSLGGIIAKMIAPITGKDTVAFNSPGVLEYLKHKDLPFHLNYDRETRELQRAVTYCAKADPTGNFRHDNDFEKYKFVDVLGGKQIREELLIHAGGGSPTQSGAHIYTPFSMIFPLVYLFYSTFLFIRKQNYKAFVILFMFFYFMSIPTIAAMIDDGEILKTYKEMFIYEP